MCEDVSSCMQGCKGPSMVLEAPHTLLGLRAKPRPELDADYEIMARVARTSTPVLESVRPRESPTNPCPIGG